MKTIKRSIPNIDTTLANTTKFFNHMEFKGIVEDENIFTIDQESFHDTQNVYVNGDDHFVSRDPLQRDITVPKDAIPLTYKLVDYLTIGSNRLFVSQSPTTNKYTIVLYTDNFNYYALEDLENYHIATIEHYIICFNNLGAKIFDTSDPSWQDLNNFVEIPVIKRVVGNQITTYDKNDLTDGYKNEYIWSNLSHPNLPDSTIADEVSVILNTSTKKYEWQLDKIDINTDYRILRQINIIPQNTDIITIEQGIICIARESYFLVSFNNGETFTTAYYPEFNGTFINIASISKDGQYFFFVTTAGVYRCYLGDFTWVQVAQASNMTPYSGGIVPSAYNGQIIGTALCNSCNFLTGDIFCFMTAFFPTNSELSKAFCIYVKGPGFKTEYDLSVFTTVVNPNYSENFIIADPLTIPQKYQALYKDNIKITIADNITHIILTSIVTVENPISSEPYWQMLMYCRSGNMKDINPDDNLLPTEPFIHDFGVISKFTAEIHRFIKLDNIAYLKDYVGSNIDEVNNRELHVYNAISASGLVFNDNEKTWFTATFSFEIRTFTATNGFDVIPSIRQLDYVLPYRYNAIPFKLAGGYIAGNKVYSDISQEWTNLPTKLDDTNFSSLISEETKKLIWVNGDYFYIQASNNLIYTNRLVDEDTAIITYTYSATTPFTKVPDVTYSDTELYLAFGDRLQITENTRDPKDNTKILFNLPAKNNQSFIDKITAMINISTTEVALFFINKIVLCSKVEDPNLGYRYDYYNTKLSTGVRLGDSVINTLEGAYTVFPTKRGLAIMNYQAFMATTDQVIEYITDPVKELWDKFYDESKPIKVIQWRNYLVLTNGSRNILLWHLTKNTWWRWQVPYNIKLPITDQLDLRLITRDELCIFTDKYIIDDKVKNLQYYDFSAIGENTQIDWFIQSQAIHFKAPNYYKNLKSLIFQLFSDNEDLLAVTMLAQIKLYRKRISLKEPETIKFKVEKLRTFVKRFNYWKINELQWGLANDPETSDPKKFRLNALSIKYELGEEVR